MNHFSLTSVISEEYSKQLIANTFMFTINCSLLQVRLEECTLICYLFLVTPNVNQHHHAQSILFVRTFCVSTVYNSAQLWHEHKRRASIT